GRAAMASEFRNLGGVIGGISANLAFGSDLGRPVRGLESRAPLRLRATKGIRGPFAPRGRSYGSRPLRYSRQAAPPDAIARRPRGDATTACAPPPATRFRPVHRGKGAALPPSVATRWPQATRGIRCR